MANLTALRASIATALSAAGRVVYAYPNTNFTPPCLVLVPSSPYIEPKAIGGAGNRLHVQFDVTAIVNGADNQAALANIETLMLDVLNALPDGTSCTSWSQPIPSEVAGQQLITSQLQIGVVTVNSGT